MLPVSTGFFLPGVEAREVSKGLLDMGERWYVQREERRECDTLERKGGKMQWEEENAKVE